MKIGRRLNVRLIALYLVCAALIGASYAHLRGVTSKGMLQPLVRSAAEPANLLPHAKLLSGSTQEPWVVIEFLDYDCPPCARFEADAERIREEYKGIVQWHVSNFPLDMHPNARRLAMWALIAADCEKLDQVHAYLLHSQSESIKARAAAVSHLLAISVKDLETREKDVNVLARLESQVASATLAGVQSTPRLLLISPSGECLEGFHPLQAVPHLLEFKNRARAEH